MFKQEHIYHGHLVHNHNITVQRILLIVLKMHLPRHIVFYRQHAVDGTRFISGQIGNTAGRAAGRRTDHHPVPLLFIQPDNGI